MGVSAHACVTMQVYIDSSVCKCVPTPAYVSVCNHLWSLGVQECTGFFRASGHSGGGTSVERLHICPCLPHCVVYMGTSVAYVHTSM